MSVDSQVTNLIEEALQVAHPLGQRDLDAGLRLLDEAASHTESGSRDSLVVTGTRATLLLWHGQVHRARVLFSRVFLTAKWMGNEGLERCAKDWLRLARLVDTRSTPAV